MFWSRRQLLLKNLALRQQLAALKRSVKRPKVEDSDRFFWMAYSRLVDGWRKVLQVSQP